VLENHAFKLAVDEYSGMSLPLLSRGDRDHRVRHDGNGEKVGQHFHRQMSSSKVDGCRRVDSHGEALSVHEKGNIGLFDSVPSCVKRIPIHHAAIRVSTRNPYSLRGSPHSHHRQHAARIGTYESRSSAICGKNSASAACAAALASTVK
jgi:hypothetical protein